MLCILLDEKNCCSELVDFSDDIENILNHHWCKTHGWLIKKKQFGARHQRATDCKHLLLSTGQGSTGLLHTLFEAWEEVVDLLDIFFHFCNAIFAEILSNFEVLENSHAWKNSAAFW